MIQGKSYRVVNRLTVGGLFEKILGAPVVLNGPQVSPPVVLRTRESPPVVFRTRVSAPVVLGGAPAVWCDRSVIGTVEIHRIGSRKVHPKSF